MKHRVFSFTAVDNFEHCRRQYKAVRVDKKYPYEPSEEAKWGDYVHTCLEAAIRDGEPLPNNVAQYQPLVDAVRQRRAAGWQIRVEDTFVLHSDGSGEMSTADDIWCNVRNQLAGKIDLLMVSPDGKEAIIADWKTNKSSKYAKPKQMDLYALGVMAALHTVERVECSLIFIRDNYKMVKSRYTRADIDRLWKEWKLKTQTIQLALINDNFPESEYTPLCGWCPVDECPNWQRGQDYLLRRKKRK